MKITCGTDIIEISRIKESIETQKNKFLEKIYTKQEIEYCESKKNQKYQHYAARFAAKEAAFKAISIQIKDKYQVSWTDFEVKNEKTGRPYIELSPKLAKNIPIKQIDLSLSHCKEYAVAMIMANWGRVLNSHLA